jgi:hypothetical protein
LAITDTNHNHKNFRYQLIAGSSVASIGVYCVDADLLWVTIVPKHLWRIEDFASDLLVLELASGKTFQALADLVGREDRATIDVLSLALLFMRVHLYGVNSISLGSSHFNLVVNALCDKYEGSQPNHQKKVCGRVCWYHLPDLSK